jgi:hypothetical protein
VFQTGGFRPSPVGLSLDGKQFGLRLDEVINLADHLPDTAAVIRVDVPRTIFNTLDHTPVDSSILRSGSITVQPDMLNMFNGSILNLQHAY